MGVYYTIKLYVIQSHCLYIYLQSQTDKFQVSTSDYTLQKIETHLKVTDTNFHCIISPVGKLIVTLHKN